MVILHDQASTGPDGLWATEKPQRGARGRGSSQRIWERLSVKDPYSTLIRDPSQQVVSEYVVVQVAAAKRLHGFHVHALGDTINGCMSTGPHFNPARKKDRASEDMNRHADDLGNVIGDEDGTVNFSIIDKQILLNGPNSIIKRVVIVHADPDDFEKDKLYSLDIYVNFIFH
uniref:Superoxide dismutase [Cu-Zn]-like n=1 Tax=Elaeis guineensis var. tenera TaxID=51953 RepID=A0A8N4F3H3_ELAGV|nr:superoxide dismutase [Cu-Zn]-like [Elaeis guineensis]